MSIETILEQQLRLYQSLIPGDYPTNGIPILWMITCTVPVSYLTGTGNASQADGPSINKDDNLRTG